MFFRKFLSLTLFFILSSSAQSTYLTASVNSLNYDEKLLTKSEVRAFQLGIGSSLSEGLFAELRLGTGLNSDLLEAENLEDKVKMRVDNYFGIYLKYHLFDSTEISLYGLVGYTEGGLIFRPVSSSARFSLSESDTSYGLGGNIYLSESHSLNFEYMNYMDVSNFEMDGFSFGYQIDF